MTHGYVISEDDWNRLKGLFDTMHLFSLSHEPFNDVMLPKALYEIALIGEEVLERVENGPRQTAPAEATA